MHKLLQEERLQGSTLLVLANKQDLDGAASSDEIRDLLKLGMKLVSLFLSSRFKIISKLITGQLSQFQLLMTKSKNCKMHLDGLLTILHQEFSLLINS